MNPKPKWGAAVHLLRPGIRFYQTLNPEIPHAQGGCHASAAGLASTAAASGRGPKSRAATRPIMIYLQNFLINGNTGDNIPCNARMLEVLREN